MRITWHYPEDSGIEAVTRVVPTKLLEAWVRSPGNELVKGAEINLTPSNRSPTTGNSYRPPSGGRIEFEAD